MLETWRLRHVCGEKSGGGRHNDDDDDDDDDEDDEDGDGDGDEDNGIGIDFDFSGGWCLGGGERVHEERSERRQRRTLLLSSVAEMVCRFDLEPFVLTTFAIMFSELTNELRALALRIRNKVIVDTGSDGRVSQEDLLDGFQRAMREEIFSSNGKNEQNGGKAHERDVAERMGCGGDGEWWSGWWW